MEYDMLLEPAGILHVSESKRRHTPAILQGMDEAGYGAIKELTFFESCIK